MEVPGGGMEGYLKKKSPKTVLGKHPWQKRWFVLQDTASGVRVVYFKTDKEAHTPLTEPLGVIPLDRVIKVELMAHKVGRFNVHVEGNRIFALWASSTVEAQKWIAAISNMRSNSRQTLSALDKDKSSQKFWKNGSSSVNMVTNKNDNKDNGNVTDKSESKDGTKSTSERRPSLVKCEGFLNKDIKSKDGVKAKGFVGRFWCRTTEHTLFFFQPEMAHKENATAMGYLSLRDIVNSDFKDTNSWFHLETRDEVWTLSVSDSGEKSFTAVNETTIAKAKAWFASINRFLEDQPRDVTEVLKQAEEEIKIQQERRRTRSQPNKDEEKPNEKQVSPKPVTESRTLEVDAPTHKQQPARGPCCSCWPCC